MAATPEASAGGVFALLQVVSSCKKFYRLVRCDPVVWEAHAHRMWPRLSRAVVRTDTRRSRRADEVAGYWLDFVCTQHRCAKRGQRPLHCRRSHAILAGTQEDNPGCQYWPLRRHCAFPYPLASSYMVCWVKKGSSLDLPCACAASALGHAGWTTTSTAAPLSTARRSPPPPPPRPGTTPRQ